MSGVPGKGIVKPGGSFNDKAKSLLRQAKGKTVSIIVKYRGPDGVGKMTAVVFNVTK